MRKILFRGKRVDNGGWTTGFPFIAGNDSCKMICAMALHPEFVDEGDVYYSEGFTVDPSTVGQYTGMTDKNGVKIFEGDIVNSNGTWWNAAGVAWHDSPIIEVEWSNYLCGFEPFAYYGCDCGVFIRPNEVEIIGNIHDNPELRR